MGPAFTRKYNTATAAGTHVRVPMIKRATVDFAVGTDWTPAAGDVTVSKDGGAAANIATLPAAVVMGNGAFWEFYLSAAELSCKQLVVTVVDAVTKAVEDQMFLVETFGDPAAMYVSDLSAAGVTLSLSQTIPMTDVTGNTTVTVGSALLAARAQGAGAWTIFGTTLTLKNPDGTTFRTFTLDSAVTPTSRT